MNLIKKIKNKLLNIEANPKSISKGYALGIFLGTTPFIGMKVFISLIITSIFKWNKISSVIGVYHFNTLTAPFFYTLSFLVGKTILGIQLNINFYENMSISKIFHLLTDNLQVFSALLVGGIVLGAPIAIFAYYASLSLINKKQNLTPELA